MDLRQTEVSTLLKWLPENLSTSLYKPLNRDETALSIGVRVGTLQRVLFELVNRGYLLQRGQKGNATYQLSTEFSTITTPDLITWIQQTTREAGERRKDRLSQVGSSSPELVSNNTLFEQSPTVNVVDDGSRIVTVTDIAMPKPSVKVRVDAVESTSGKSLSPIQQLLQQAQQLAEQESRREAETEKPVPELAGMETRLNLVESRVGSIATFFEQAAVALKSLLAPTTTTFATIASNPEPQTPPTPTTRALLVRLVNSYSAAARCTEHDTWRYLYGQLHLRTGFDVYMRAGSLPKSNGDQKDQTYLTVVEDSGKLEALYEIAKRMLILS